MRRVRPKYAFHSSILAMVERFQRRRKIYAAVHNVAGRADIRSQMLRPLG
jgi:hypothetical protein